MQLFILSDIHGNLSAIQRVIEDVTSKYHPDGVIMLGDLIDYGMCSNEVLTYLRKLELPWIGSLWGNHEYAILTENYSHFSSNRGVLSAKRTKDVLTDRSIEYLQGFNGKQGFLEFEVCGKQFLAIHGTRSDPFWGELKPNSNLSGYENYDYVLSGHTHCAHAFSYFYDSDDENYRNKKRTFFLNPGSVGQPRNHDPRAQYAILDFEYGVHLCGVNYDIEYEQSLFTNDVDFFYKERLTLGV